MTLNFGNLLVMLLFDLYPMFFLCLNFCSHQFYAWSSLGFVFDLTLLLLLFDCISMWTKTKYCLNQAYLCSSNPRYFLVFTVSLWIIKAIRIAGSFCHTYSPTARLFYRILTFWAILFYLKSPLMCVHQICLCAPIYFAYSFLIK